MNQKTIFESETLLPNDALAEREGTLIGFEPRYSKIRGQLRLLLEADGLEKWNHKFHSGELYLCELVVEQYPLVIFYGDVGTGKTAIAETIANRLVTETGQEDSVLFKLSNRVRGNGMVGEMGTRLSEAFEKVVTSAGKRRRAMLIIDEVDSIGASRAQEHSHHEDKVAVNTLIQGIDDLRRYNGRIVVLLCTNRLSALDPALRRRAAIIEKFERPSDVEREELFKKDLAGLKFSSQQISALVDRTASNQNSPAWTYSDIRTRLYPAALAKAYPDRPLSIDDILSELDNMQASPVICGE